MNKNRMSVGFAVLVVVLGFHFVTLESAVARSWTCGGTIALTGTNYSFALPGWEMSGKVPGPGVDREKRCKEYIEANWLRNGAIWAKLGIPVEQQNQYCQSGGTFRIDYGHSGRNKDWSFAWSGKPICKCSGPMSFQ